MVTTEVSGALSDSGGQVSEHIAWTPGAVTADPALNVFYVVDLTNERIVVVDAATGSFSAAAVIGEDLTGGFFEFSIDGSRVFYSTPETSRIHSFDTGTLASPAVLDVPYAIHSFIVASDGTAFGFYPTYFQGDLRGHFSIHIDLETGERIRYYPDFSYIYSKELPRLSRDGYGTRMFLQQRPSPNQTKTTGEWGLFRPNQPSSIFTEELPSEDFVYDENMEMFFAIGTSEIASANPGTGERFSVSNVPGREGIALESRNGSSEVFVLYEAQGRRYVCRLDKNSLYPSEEWDFTYGSSALDITPSNQGFALSATGDALFYRGVTFEGGFYLGMIRTEASAGKISSVGGLVASQGRFPDRVVVDWKPVTGATEYKVYRAGSNEAFSLAEDIGTTSSTQWTDSMVAGNSEYSYWVTAIAGAEESLPGPVSIKGSTSDALPSVPIGLKSLGSYNKALIEFSWFEVLNATHYEVYRTAEHNLAEATLIGTTDAPFWSDSDVSENPSFSYWVKAVNEIGSSDFSAHSFRPSYSPVGPPGPVVSATDGVHAGEIRVFWGWEKSADSYKVYRSIKGDYDSQVLVADEVRANSYVDTDVVDGVTYVYLVAAVSEFGETHEANLHADSGHTRSDLPVVPLWVDASDEEFHEKVVIEWERIGNATSYSMYRRARNIPEEFALVASGLTEPRAEDVPPHTETEYLYKVEAHNEHGTSPLSHYTSGSRLPPPPPAPENLTATQGEHMFHIQLEWDPVPGITGYEVYYNDEDNFETATHAVTVSDTSWRLNRPVLDQTYWFWVTSHTHKIDSEPSESATGFATEIPLPTPDGLSASQGTHRDEIQLSWNEVEEATYYEIYRNTVDDPESASYHHTATHTTSRDLVAEPGVTYYYYVVATSSRQTSSFSSPATGFLGPQIPDVAELSYATDGTYPDAISVRWSGSSQAESYDLLRSESLTGPFVLITNTTGNIYYDHDVVFGVRYFYQVQARNSEGVAERSEVDSGYVAPGSPEEITVTQGIFQGVVGILWSPTEGTTTYEVLRRDFGSSGEFEVIASTADTFFFDSTVVAGKEYEYSVRSTVNGLAGPRQPYPQSGYGTVGLPFRPDALVGERLRRMRGNNVYRVGKRQEVRYTFTRLKTKLFLLQAQNDGETIDFLNLYGSKGNRFFQTNFIDLSGRNITARMRSGAFGFTLPGKESGYVILKSKPRRAAKKRRTSKVISFRTTSLTDRALSDAVRIRLSSPKP
ncbi:MAG: hypothetical protein CMO55_25125 [Verrucomicrobiales bacterium]|nr:hypothetical protein [Verrucomicrobiales bacterium]